MPVVLRVGGFAFKIVPGDHDPPHVHVRYAGKKCKIVLANLDIPRSNMSAGELSRAVAIVTLNRVTLYQAWVEVVQRQGSQR